MMQARIFIASRAALNRHSIASFITNNPFLKTKLMTNRLRFHAKVPMAT